MRPPPRGVPSRPTAWRRISAPVSWVWSARSASAAAASLRSARSSSTHRPWERTSGRASAASRATSAAVSSTSSNRADQRTLVSWWAPDHAVARGLGEEPQARATACGGTAAGTRTSKPAASSAGPVTVISSHASSWLRYTWPRRRAPARRSRAKIRSRRASSSARGLVSLPSARASSIGSSVPSAPGPSTERNQASPLSGGSSWTTSVGWRRRPARPPVDPLGHLGPGGDRCLERRAVEAGDERLGDGGGGAGHRRRGRELELPAASQGDGVDHRAQHVEGDGPGVGAGEGGDRAGHGVGQAGDLGLVDQGRRPADVQVHGLALRLPLAAEGGHDAALRDEADGGDRDPAEPGDAGADAVAPRPPPTATSQPSASSTGIDRASAWTPPGSETPACTAQPRLGPPSASSRSASSSLPGGDRRGRRPTPRSAGGPRRLEPHLAGRVGGRDQTAARIGGRVSRS